MDQRARWTATLIPGMNNVGKLAGCYAVSLTHSYRITLTLLITEKEIILLDIGSHDDVYR
jgi:hypothetical protein